MTICLWCVILPIAIISTGLCVFLWFRETRRVMRERQSTVQSAERQLTVCREKARLLWDDPETSSVLARSEQIYCQAVDLYNQTRKRPLYYIPARLMGYRRIQ